MSPTWGYLLAVLLGASNAPVDIRVSLSPPEIPFHKQATLSIAIEAPPELEIRPPEVERYLGGTELYGAPVFQSEMRPNGRRLTVTRYIVEALKPGDYSIGPVEVTWPEGGSAVAPAVTLRVRDLTPEEEADVARFEPIALPQRPGVGLREVWPYLGGAVAAVGLVSLGLFLLMRRRVPESGSPITLPWDTAVAELHRLRAKGYIEAGDFEPYYVELTGILRRYIEARFRLHAPEQTTPEFLNAASQDGVLSTDHQNLLGSVLRHGDLVKFARYTPTSLEMQTTFEDVSRFVAETTPPPEPATEEAA